MTRIVLDASLAIELAMPQRGQEQAAQKVFDAVSRGNLQLHVPDLYFVEIANWAWKARFSHRPGVPRSAALAMAGELLAIPLHVTPVSELVSPALNLAFEVTEANRAARPMGPQLRVYDAIYVALADHLRIELWTADRRLHNAVRAGASAELAARVKLFGVDPMAIA